MREFSIATRTLLAAGCAILTDAALLADIDGARMHYTTPNTDCSNLPGRWRGFSHFNPLAERYTFSWSNTTGSFDVVNTNPSRGEWTHAVGQLSPDNSTATMYFPEPNVWLEGPVAYNCQYIAWNNTSEWAKDVPIDTVHLIFMSHLDVGFTDLIAPSLNTYFTTYYPRAYTLINGTKGTAAPFSYATHPWLVELYLHCPANFTLSNVTVQCPSAADQALMRSYISSADIYFHAAPFNVEWEMVASKTMGAEFMGLAQDLALELGVPAPRTASVRDVPGVTRSLVPILAAAGVPYLSEGVNPETLPPIVPSPSIWRDEASGTQVLYVQHSFGYGGTRRMPSTAGRLAPVSPYHFSHPALGDANCAIVPGFSEALCFDFRAEGQGPPESIQEVQQVYAAFQAEFPNSSVVLSTFDGYMDALAAVADTMLPTFTSEIGDVWMLGGASDPTKVTFYRQAAAAYEQCLASGACDTSDPRIRAWRTYFLKTPEHTWGLHELSDSTTWANGPFHAALKSNPTYLTQAGSYIEQRNLSSVYSMAALADHPLADAINAAMSAWTPSMPVPGSDFTHVMQGSWGNPVSISTDGGPVALALDPVSGALGSLNLGGQVLANASAGRRMGVLVYRAINGSDYNEVGTMGNCQLCYNRNGEEVANPNSTRTEVVVTDVYANGGGLVPGPAPRTILVRAVLPDPTLVANVGGFGEAWINYTVTVDGSVLVDVQLFDKTPTRLGEAVVLEWKPVQPTVPATGAWYMDKVGSWVDPLDVVENGGIMQHAVGQGLGFIDPSAGPAAGGVFIDTVDAPVVCPGSASTPYSVLPIRQKPLPGPVTDWASMLFTNGWIMNYPLWSLDTDFRFRFALRVEAPSP